MLDGRSRGSAVPIGERLGPAKPSSPVGLLAIGIIVIATLYFAREIFVPLASAILLSVALGPIAALLRRWGFGRVLSVVAAVGLAVLIISSIAAVVCVHTVNLVG